MYPENQSSAHIWKPLLIGGAAVFLYAGILVKLAKDWWLDENYSHGLLVPVVIAFILVQDRSRLRQAVLGQNPSLGIPLLLFALFVLLAGTLGAELYLQRLSIVVFLGAITIGFFGFRLLLNLWVPLILLLFSIPIPQILFNKISFPLQIWASQLAEVFMDLAGIVAIRNGNILELVPIGTAQVVALEVVEACSGIRSLMTLATLAVLLAYFTRNGSRRTIRSTGELLSDPLVWRAILLVLMAVPIALVTNALRVAGSGIITYFYGVDAAEGAWHDFSGFGVFAFAFILLAAANLVLLRFIPNGKPGGIVAIEGRAPVSQQLVLAFFVVIVSAGVVINWLEHRGETQVDRRKLSGFPIYLNGTTQIGDDRRFPEATEAVLGASDYIMRDFRTPTGQRINLYVGYYESQRTGATYHSPRNCLPGTGWELSESAPVRITTPSGKTFTANRYLVRRGDYQGMMVYWYQGRGRTNASEYWDKLGTVADSISKNRTDGAMIRIMISTAMGEDVALEEVSSFASIIAQRLPIYVPD